MEQVVRFLGVDGILFIEAAAFQIHQPVSQGVPRTGIRTSEVEQLASRLDQSNLGIMKDGEKLS